MKQITTISDDPSQSLFINLDDGSVVTLTLNYRPAIQRWAFGFTYGTKGADGLLLSLHPNILRPFRNILPFGLAVISTDGVDPVLMKDFVNGRVSLHVLTAAEVADLEDTILRNH